VTPFTQAIIDLTRELHAKTIKVTCAWCGKVLHDGPPGDISHGICDDCKGRVLEDLC